ncbi:CLCA_X family protein [Alteromonas flava]|uniref:CLCA_X family protein n=1 Tax=Alteromonas flava TaxID=2048003 RepID=UPI000C289632|nr:CLCA_X family protein [Alteromonas flava]
MSQPGRLQKPFYRNGENHRAGADVTFSDIKRVFGFRSITIGRWVNRSEQQIAANLFFDALCDLSDLLAVPTPVISLNGTLSLAFGTGGRKSVSAHYDSSNATLALAKNAGGGALAHEWFHAFDHYIAKRAFVDAGTLDFASELWLQGKTTHPHPLNNLLNEWFQMVFFQPNAIDNEALNSSAYLKRSVAIDRQLNTFYYSRPQEITARAFESVLQDNPIKNHFLVAGTKQSTEAQLGAYPTLAERQELRPLLYRYFSQLGAAIRYQQEQRKVR